MSLFKALARYRKPTHGLFLNTSLSYNVSKSQWRSWRPNQRQTAGAGDIGDGIVDVGVTSSFGAIRSIGARSFQRTV